MTPFEFIKQIAGSAVIMGKRYNVPASLLIAQAMKESGNGNSMLTSKYNNLAGMKVGSGKGVWSGKKVSLPTSEYTSPTTKVSVLQDFRTYDSLEQSIQDLADRYANRFGITLDKFGGNADSYIQYALGKTGYATDPGY